MQMKAVKEARIDEETTIVVVKLPLVYASDGTGLHQQQQHVEGDHQSAGSLWNAIPMSSFMAASRNRKTIMYCATGCK